jgi:hypothetical protein
MDARSTNRKNGSTRRVTLHRGCLGVGNHPPTSKDGKSLITHDSHSERTKGRKQKQDSPRNAPPNPPHLAPRPPRSPLRQRQQWTMQRQTNGERPTAQSLSLSLSLYLKRLPTIPAPHQGHLGVHPDSSNDGPRSPDRLRRPRCESKVNKGRATDPTASLKNSLQPFPPSSEAT